MLTRHQAVCTKHWGATRRNGETETRRRKLFKSEITPIKLTPHGLGLRAGYYRSGVCGQPLPAELDESTQVKLQRLAHPQLGLPPMPVSKDFRLAMAADRA